MKQLPKLTLVTKSDAPSSEGESNRRAEAFELVSLGDLTPGDQSAVQRLVNDTCPRATILAVARTPRAWDLRPVVAKAGEDGPSVIRSLAKDLKGAAHLNARVRETFDRLNMYPDLSSMTLDWGFLNGNLWYRRPLVEQTLAHLLAAKQSLSEEQTLRVAFDIVDAVSAWHNRGVVHGHLVSSNVFIGADRRISLLDPAVGLALNQALRAAADYDTNSFAPEVVDGQTVAYSSDVYGLGLVFRRLFLALSTRYQFEKNREQLEASLRPYIDLSAAMLERDPLRRPSLEQVYRLVGEAAGRLDPSLVRAKKEGSTITVTKPAANKPREGAVPPVESEQSERQVVAKQPARAGVGPFPRPGQLAKPQQGKLIRTGKSEAGAPAAAMEATNTAPSESLAGSGSRIKVTKEEPAAVERIEVFKREDEPLGAGTYPTMQPTGGQPAGYQGPEYQQPVMQANYNPQYVGGASPYGVQQAVPVAVNTQYSPPPPFMQQPIPPQGYAAGHPMGMPHPVQAGPYAPPPYPGQPYAQQPYVGQLPPHLAPSPYGAAPVYQPVHQGAPYVPLGYAHPDSTPGGLPEGNYHRINLMKSEPRRSEGSIMPMLFFFGLCLVALYVYRSGRTDQLPLVGDWLNGPQATTDAVTDAEIKAAWEGGMPSRMIPVAEAALQKDSPSIAAETVIVRSVRNGERALPGVDVELLRVAFQTEWEADLKPSDRRVALALGLAGLLKERLPQDLEGFDRLHPGVLFALTANAGKNTTRILSSIPAKIMTVLPPPYGPAFTELLDGSASLSCGDPGVQQLARIMTRGDAGIEELSTFLGEDADKRLRALAMFASFDNRFSRAVLAILLGLPQLSTDHPLLKWANGAELTKWSELPSADQIFVVAGMPPAATPSGENLIKLLNHPAATLRSYAIEKSIDRLKMLHPGAKEVFSLIKQNPALLGADQTKELAQMLKDPAQVSLEQVMAWTKNDPPVTVVAPLLLASHKAKEATPVDVGFAKYLKDKKWVPDLNQLKILATHPDTYTRLFAYDQIYALKDAETARDFLSIAITREQDPQNKKLLEQMILDLNREPLAGSPGTQSNG